MNFDYRNYTNSKGELKMSYRICPLSDHVTGVLDGQRLKGKLEFCWELDVENTFTKSVFRDGRL